MSVQGEINRISKTVDNQSDLIAQIQLALSNKTIVKEGSCKLYVDIGPSPVLAEGVIIMTES